MKLCTLCKSEPVSEGSWCLVCQRDYAKQYKQKNQERIAQLNRDWRSLHREQQALYKKAYYQTPKGVCVELCRSAKRRASKKKVPHAITAKQLHDLWVEQEGCCVLTGVPLQTRGGLTYDSPSVDRKEPKQGYTPRNIRLVCYGMNCCLHDFGEDFFRPLAKNLILGTTLQPKLDLPKISLNAETRYRSSYAGVITALYHSSKKHAKEKGLDHQLTKEEILELFWEPHCALTKVHFDFQVGLGRANPLRPSLDRIDSSAGYYQGNVRLVCSAINYALNAFGEEALQRLCAAYLENTRWI